MVSSGHGFILWQHSHINKHRAGLVWYSAKPPRRISLAGGCNILQGKGSVAMQLKCGGTFNKCLIPNFSDSVTISMDRSSKHFLWLTVYFVQDVSDSF